MSLAQGDITQAQIQVEEPFGVYLACYRVLRADKDSRAREIWNITHNLLQERAVKIGDEQLRRLFLESVSAHREIVSEFAYFARGQ